MRVCIRYYCQCIVFVELGHYTDRHKIAAAIDDRSPPEAILLLQSLPPIASMPQTIGYFKRGYI